MSLSRMRLPSTSLPSTSIRSTGRRHRVRTGLLALALACLPASAVAAGVACTSDAPVWLSLTITAGALPPETDRDTVVRIRADGCAELHRPAYLRDAGDFRIALGADELKLLRERVESSGLRRFDGSQAQAKLSTLQEKRGAERKSARAEIFTVLDADRYQLHWQDAISRGSADWNGLPEYAKAYPEVTELQGLSDMAEALQAIARRSDATRIDGATP